MVKEHDQHQHLCSKPKAFTVEPQDHDRLDDPGSEKSCLSKPLRLEGCVWSSFCPGSQGVSATKGLQKTSLNGHYRATYLFVAAHVGNLDLDLHVPNEPPQEEPADRNSVGSNNAK